MNGYEKWDKKHVVHPKTHAYAFRKRLLEFVVQKGFRSIIEIGPGALVEYKIIKQRFPEVKYIIADVSDNILSKTSKQHPDIRRIRCAIEELESKVDSKEFDIVYASHVFEHTKNPQKAIKNAINSAKHFQFVFFKWRFEGDLKPSYRRKKAYWSSMFNIYMIEKEIKRYGNIERSFICNNKTGEQTDFNKYRRGKTGQHRTGNYLIYQGSSKS